MKIGIDHLRWGAIAPRMISSVQGRLAAPNPEGSLSQQSNRLAIAAKN